MVVEKNLLNPLETPSLEIPATGNELDIFIGDADFCRQHSEKLLNQNFSCRSQCLLTSPFAIENRECSNYFVNLIIRLHY